MDLTTRSNPAITEEGKPFYPPLRDVRRDRFEEPRASAPAELSAPEVIYSEDFKQWFGDWEDPDAVHSLALYDDGRPAVLFHGTTHTVQALSAPEEAMMIDRGLGAHLAYDNRVTDRFTVGDRARDHSGFAPSLASPAEKAMAELEEGGQVIPVFANVRRALDLTRGFEPLGIGEEIVTRVGFDENLVAMAVRWFALQEEPDLLGPMAQTWGITAERMRKEAVQSIAEIQQGEHPFIDEVPPGGELAALLRNRASFGMDPDLNAKIIDAFRRSTPYDSVFYLNTAPMEVREEEFDRRTVIVFEPEDVSSIWATEWGTQDLGTRRQNGQNDSNAMSQAESTTLEIVTLPEEVPVHLNVGYVNYAGTLSSILARKGARKGAVRSVVEANLSEVVDIAKSRIDPEENHIRKKFVEKLTGYAVTRMVESFDKVEGTIRYVPARHALFAEHKTKWSAFDAEQIGEWCRTYVQENGPPDAIAIEGQGVVARADAAGSDDRNDTGRENGEPSGDGATGNPPSSFENRIENMEERTGIPPGDGAPTGEPTAPTPHDDDSGSEPSRPNPSDEEVLRRLPDLLATVFTQIDQKRDRIEEKGGDPSDLIESLLNVDTMLRAAYERRDMDYETARTEAGIEEAVPDYGEAETQAEAAHLIGSEEGPFGFNAANLDDTYRLRVPFSADFYLAIRPTQSAGAYLDYDASNPNVEVTVNKALVDALKPGDNGALAEPLYVESVEWGGGSWDVEVGAPFNLTLSIQSGDSFPGHDESTTGKGARMKLVSEESEGNFVLFVVALARLAQGSIEELRTRPVQWRVTDFAAWAREERSEEQAGPVPEGFLRPVPSNMRVLRREGEEADPTVFDQEMEEVLTEDVPAPSIEVSEEEITAAADRARQTGVKTAMFWGHGVDGTGQPAEVTRFVIGEKHYKTKNKIDHDPRYASWHRWDDPQTASVGTTGDRRERGKIDDMKSMITGFNLDLDDPTDGDFRVAPVQRESPEGAGPEIDTFWLWNVESAIDGASNARKADDLPGVPTEADLSSADLEGETGRVVVGEDESFEAVHEDIDLTGRDPVRLSDDERREMNRKAVEVITEKNPVQISDEDRDVLLQYTGAGGLGADTGTGSREGERNEHYTDYELIEAMWAMADGLGADGNVLEPGSGIGNFAGLRPNDHTGHMVMVEKSPTTADIAKVLYPEQQVLNQSLSVVDFRHYQLQAAIGNVPFGSRTIHADQDPVTDGIQSKVRIHDYFILKAIDAVEDGGIVALITSTTTADRENNEIRRRMMEEAVFLGGFRLPATTFESNASTSVTTDLLVFQKRPDKAQPEDVPEEIQRRSNLFADSPAMHEKVLGTDRSEPTEDQKELVRRLRGKRDELGDVKEKIAGVEARIKEVREEKAQYSHYDDEYRQLGKEKRQLTSERRNLRSEKRSLEGELRDLESTFEEADVVNAKASLNRYFQSNPDRVLGKLKHGYKRPTLHLLGVDGPFGDEQRRKIREFSPQVPFETPEPKNLFAEKTGQRIGFERQHPDGAIVHKDGTFYESLPVGYGEVSPEHPEVARSAVGVLDAYDVFTTALARDAKNVEPLRQALKKKLRDHVRSHGLPGSDDRLMNEDLKYDPRRPTLASLVEKNEVGTVAFADVVDADTWYNGGQHRATIEDDENLDAVAQFLRSQGEDMTAEGFANFYRGGSVDIDEMQSILEESAEFFFVPSVGPVVVEDLSDDTLDKVADELDLTDERGNRLGGSALEEKIVRRAIESYEDRVGEWRHRIYFTSGELYTRLDLYERLEQAATTDEHADEIGRVIDELDEALPQRKEYHEISLDPRMVRSWLPEEVVKQWIRDEIGYETEMEFIDEAQNPENYRLILRFSNGTYIQGANDDAISIPDDDKGWHGIPYHQILKRYLRLQNFPLRWGNKWYVDPDTREPLDGTNPVSGTEFVETPEVTSRSDAKDVGVYRGNKKVQAENETRMQEEIPQDFQDWADGDASDEMRERIEEAYNRSYRSTAQPKFDGSSLNLKGFNFPEEIYRHNQIVAEKMVYNRKGGDCHVVGAGKTFAAILTMETLRNRGLLSKPLVVVPSQVIEKWMAEYKEFFPDRNVLKLEGKEKGLREELPRAQLYDYDTIFITQTGFKRVEIQPEVQKKRLRERKQKNWDRLEELENYLSDKYPKNEWEPIINGLEEEIEQWEEDITEINEDLQEQAADVGVYLDELGIDGFVLDEAHAYKNARAPSQQAAEMGIAKQKGQVSARAEAAKKKADWLHWTLGDDVNSFILTATPIENNPLEIWHMLQLCAPSVLEKYQIESLDAFIDLFIRSEKQMRRQADGQFALETVVVSYKNVQELQDILDEVLDIKSYEQLVHFYQEEDPQYDDDGNIIQPFSRPDKSVDWVELEPSELHELLLEDVKLRADIIRAAAGCGNLPPITDNFLSLTTDGGTIAEDLRLFQPAYWGFEGDGLKIEPLVEKVVEEYNREGLPLDKEGKPLRQNPEGEARTNPTITDRFGAPVGLDRSRSNTRDLGPQKSGSTHVRENPEAEELVSDTEGMAREIAGRAPRNQIIFTSSSSMKGGPYKGENPLELPYAKDVKPYQKFRFGEIETKDPELAEVSEEWSYVEFEDASWLRHIKQNLVEQGIPANDIAIVSGTVIGLEEGPDGEMRDRFVDSDADKNNLKAEVQEQFQKGEINVIIGTNAISEGMNLDRYTTRIYHLDVPWKPSRVEQRNGRGLRQNNIYPEVEIDFLLLERSFDSYRLQLVDRKQDWISSVLYSDENTVRTAEGESGGNSQALPYQEMMVATSEDPRIKDFFEAQKFLDRVGPRIDRIEDELNSFRRKKRTAESDLEEARAELSQLEEKESESVQGAHVPETGQEAVDEGLIEIRNLRHKGAREFACTVETHVTEDRSFQFRSIQGGDPQAIQFSAEDRNPDAFIRYVWGEKTSEGYLKTTRKTYFKRKLQGTICDQDDWLAYHEEEIREHYRKKRLEEAREDASDPDQVTEDDIDSLPDELTVQNIYDENDLSYRDTKKELGIDRDGRLSLEEWASHWVAVIEEHFPGVFLRHEDTYVDRSESRIRKRQRRVSGLSSRVDELGEFISEREETLARERDNRSEARSTVQELSDEVNDAMSRPFAYRRELYEEINRRREEFGIEHEIPTRRVGVLKGAELTGGDEPDEPDEPGKEVEVIDDEDDDEPTYINVDVPIIQRECPDRPLPSTGGDSEPSGGDEPTTPGVVSEDREGEEEPEPVTIGEQEPSESARPPLYETTDAGTPIISNAAEWYSLLQQEGIDPPVDLPSASEADFDEHFRLRNTARELLAEVDRDVFIPKRTLMYDLVPAVSARVDNEDDEKGIRGRVGAQKHGFYVDGKILVTPPHGDDAYEMWIGDYAARRGEGKTEVRRELQRFGNIDLKTPPKRLIPGVVGQGAVVVGIVVPAEGELRGNSGEAPGVLDAYYVLDLSARGQTAWRGSGANQYLYVVADWLTFARSVLQQSDESGLADVELTLPPQADQAKYTPPALRVVTDTGIQAVVLTETADGAGITDGMIGTGDVMEASRENPPEVETGGDRGLLGHGYVRRQNPEPTAVADVDTDHALSYLARTDPGSLQIEGQERSIRATEEEVHHLFTDPDGSLLLVVPESNIDRLEVPEGTGTEAEEFFEEFHHYDADEESMVLDLPDESPDESAKHIGFADEIIYDSDKVMRPGDQKGREHDYVHEFDDGERPIYTWGDVFIIDGVAIDGRGILN